MNRRRSSMFDIQGRDPMTINGRSQIRTKQNLIISDQFEPNVSPAVLWSLIEGSRRQSRMEADSSLSFNSSTELFRPSSPFLFRLYLRSWAEIYEREAVDQKTELFAETQGQDNQGNDMRTTINWVQMKNQFCQNFEKRSKKFSKPLVKGSITSLSIKLT